MARSWTGSWRRGVRAGLCGTLLVFGSWPGTTWSSHAQVILEFAQAELRRASGRLTAAMASGKAPALINAVAAGEKAIQGAQGLPTGSLDMEIASVTKLWARAYLQYIGQLIGSCEKGGRIDGQFARDFLVKVETGAGDLADPNVIHKYRSRLAKCLPVSRYEGTYTFKSKLPNSSQSYVAKVTWTLWQQLPGGMRTYRASGRIDAVGSKDTCSGSLHTTIDKDLGLLTVNEITGSGDTITNTYMFAFGTRELMKLTCPKGDPVLEALSGGETCDAQEYFDVTRLIGSCKRPGFEGRWRFEAVKE